MHREWEDGLGANRDPRRTGALGSAGKFLPTLTVLVSALMAVPATGQDAGTRSPLLMGVGARALAMGRTATATTSQSDALFWNPARLSALEYSEVQGFRTRLSGEGLAYHSALVGHPTLGLGTFALGYQRFGTSDLDGRDDRNLSTGSFGFSETHLLLGYGRALHPTFSLGATVRVEQQRVGDLQATGLGLDLGLAYERDWGASHGILAGLHLQNAVEPVLKLDQEEVPDPRSLRLGVGIERDPDAGRLSWALATDLEIPRLADARWGVGAEVGFQELFFLRGGSDDGQPTLGFGVAWKGVQVDYAFRNEPDLDRSDRFTVGIQFGGSVPERRAELQRKRQESISRQLGSMLEAREREALKDARAAADAAYRARDWEEAATAYRRVLALAPDDATATQRLDDSLRQIQLAEATAAWEARDMPTAAALARGILERWPDDAEAARILDLARSALRDAEDRRAELDAMFAAALANFADGNLDDASAQIDELLRIEPDHALARELSGRIAALVAEREAAALAAAQAREAERLRAQRAAEEARAQASLRTTPARPVATPTAEQRIELDRRYQAGMRAFQASDFDGATREWRWIFDQWPRYGDVADQLVQAYLFLGIQSYGQGDYDRAEQHCQRALEVEPGHEKAERYLANIREERSEFQRRKVGR